MDHHGAAEGSAASFLFATCQIGAEAALKREVQRRWPALRFAYSRPGFLTFKLPPEWDDRSFRLDCVFARAWGYSLGKLTDDDVDQRARRVWDVSAEFACEALHVWQRDMARPGWRGFEPHITPAALQAEMAIRRRCPIAGDAEDASYARIAKPGQRVLDCVLVEADEWWIGWHRAADSESCFPGGIREIAQPTHAVSRAYVKMTEALAWSALPVAPNERVAELGCAPGGASQALLERGLIVIGIDPAKVDPRLLSEKNFTHVQKRAADVRRREFGDVRWLAADMNVDPHTALDAVEAIVTHSAVNIQGLLLTLKLLDWNMADAIGEYLQRVRRWGYNEVRARQLAHNRQEFCVAAIRTAPTRRRRPSAIKRRPAKRRD